MSGRTHQLILAVGIFIGMLARDLPGQAPRNDKLFHQGAIRVLILSGHNNHDWRTTTPFLRRLLEDTGRFDARVCETPIGITAETLSPFDVLVDDYGGPRWGSTSEKAIENFVSSGKGLVAVHGALYYFSGLEVLGDHHVASGIKEPAWPDFARMVKGYWPSPPPNEFHAPFHLFEVKITRPDHPIVQGMSSSFTTADELYHSMTLLPGADVIATAYDDPRNGGTGKDEPILFASSYGNCFLRIHSCSGFVKE